MTMTVQHVQKEFCGCAFYLHCAIRIVEPTLVCQSSVRCTVDDALDGVLRRTEPRKPTASRCQKATASQARQDVPAQASGHWTRIDTIPEKEEEIKKKALEAFFFIQTINQLNLFARQSCIVNCSQTIAKIDLFSSEQTSNSFFG